MLALGLVILLFVGLAHEVLGEQETQFDQRVAEFIRVNIVVPKLTGWMEAITFLASRNFLILAYSVMIIYFLWKERFRVAITVAGIGLGAFLINYFLKIIYHRNRPDAPIMPELHNFSFPSGHANSAFVFYGLLIYLCWQTRWPVAIKWVITSLLFMLAVLIGFSRIYLRMHFASDVIAGFLTGIACILVALILLKGSESADT